MVGVWVGVAVGLGVAVAVGVEVGGTGVSVGVGVGLARQATVTNTSKMPVIIQGCLLIIRLLRRTWHAKSAATVAFARPGNLMKGGAEYTCPPFMATACSLPEFDCYGNNVGFPGSGGRLVVVLKQSLQVYYPLALGHLRDFLVVLIGSERHCCHGDEQRLRVQEVAEQYVFIPDGFTIGIERELAE